MVNQIKNYSEKLEMNGYALYLSKFLLKILVLLGVRADECICYIYCERADHPNIEKYSSFIDLFSITLFQNTTEHTFFKFSKQKYEIFSDII